MNIADKENKIEEIDLAEIYSAIIQRKFTIIITTFLFTVAAAAFAYMLPNIYTSEVTLIPAEESGLKMPGQLGGLAALAGVSLGSMNGGNKAGLAIEILKSRDFIGRFIEQNDLFIPIMAAKGWSRTSNELIIDPEIYDVKTKTWIRDVEEPFKPKPSILETTIEFNKLFYISRDDMSGVITLRIETYSPYLAKIWLDKLVKSINEEIRTRDLNEADKSIDYLNQQIEQTNLVDIKTMLFSLIEEQTKTKMLAHAREEYVLKTIDSAVVAELKSSPKRVLIIFMAFMLGIVISTMTVTLSFISRKS